MQGLGCSEHAEGTHHTYTNTQVQKLKHKYKDTYTKVQNANTIHNCAIVCQFTAHGEDLITNTFDGAELKFQLKKVLCALMAQKQF